MPQPRSRLQTPSDPDDASAVRVVGSAVLAVRRGRLDPERLARRRAAAEAGGARARSSAKADERTKAGGARGRRARGDDEPVARSQRAELRTENARRAVQLSSLYATLMSDHVLAGYEPELGRPSSSSTERGAMAKQPLSLVRGAERIAFGYIDVVAARCHLKSFERLEELHRLRHRRGLPFDRADYARLYVATADLARQRGLEVRREEPADAARTES